MWRAGGYVSWIDWVVLLLGKQMLEIVVRRTRRRDITRLCVGKLYNERRKQESV